MKEEIEKAILAFQRVAMAHPASDEHSRDMYLTCEEARRGLITVLQKQKENQDKLVYPGSRYIAEE